MKLGGQIRVTSSMSAMGGASVMIIGWDMTAAFTLGDALGIDRLLMAEFLPDVESVVVAKMNEGIRNSDGA